MQGLMQGEVVLDVIAQRRTSSRLVEPGPSTAQLATILRAGAQAPDHGRCRPWRFTVVPPEATYEFGAVLARAYALRCARQGVPVDPRRRAREAARPSRSPVFLVVGCRPEHDNERIPEYEQFAAVAAATQNILLAATAMGFGSKWATGPAATDPVVKRAVGLNDGDTIVGFVHLGTLVEPAQDRGMSARDAVVPSIWSPGVPDAAIGAER